MEKSPADMHARIAAEFHRIEKKKFKDPLSYEEILASLEGFRRIIPQGSPMAGIGNHFQYVTLSNCFASGTKIITDQGLMPIELAQIGMKTVTHKGQWKTITQTHKNLLEGRSFGSP